MKILFTFIVILLSVGNVSAESPACDAVIEALGIDASPAKDGVIRKFRFTGMVDKAQVCEVTFLPDFCTFQLDAPLKSPLMYYLTDTEVSSVKIQYRAGEKFYLRSTTKESDVSELVIKRKFTKILNLKKSEKGIEVEFRMSEGRFVPKVLSEFKCTVNVPGHAEI